MNIFRFAGDMAHLASFFLLGWRLWEKKNANGASPRAGDRLDGLAGVGQRRAATGGGCGSGDGGSSGCGCGAGLVAFACAHAGVRAT